MLKQPVGFKKLTNVAIVKFKYQNNKYEIACYKNKVLDWRNGLETNLDEVLQVEEIFSNAVSGEICKAKDLENAFEDQPKRKIIEMVGTDSC